MIDVSALAQRVFGSQSRKLVVGGLEMSEIVATTGTPVFVYDSDVLKDRASRLRRALPTSYDLYYSIKANPNRSIIRVFLGLGCGLKVASAGEFYQGVAAGCDPAHILFAGPGKTAAELESVVAGGIGEIHVESLLQTHNTRLMADNTPLKAPCQACVFCS